MLMILWKNIFINQIISNLTMEVVTSSFLVVFSFLLLSYIAADIQCLLNEIMIKKGGGRRWIIPTAVNKQKLWASTQGAKYTNVISLASTTSTLSFPLLTMIWWHSTHSENPLVLFAYVFYPQFSSVQSLSRVWLFATPTKAVAYGSSLSLSSPSCLVALVPWYSHYMTTSWCAMPLSLSPSCEYNTFCFPKPLSFLFLQPYPTNHLIKMQNTLKWFHKILICCTQWHSKSRLTLAWNRD